MSIKIMTLVWDTDMGGAIRKSVALKLADHSNHEGRSIYPGIDEIARATEIHRVTVIRTLQSLVKDGFIQVEKEGGGRGYATEYRFNLQKLSIKGSATLPIKGEDGLHSATVLESERVAVSAKKGSATLPQPSLTVEKGRSAPKKLREEEGSYSVHDALKYKGGQVRDTQESLGDYTARMIAEGKFKGRVVKPLPPSKPL